MRWIENAESHFLFPFHLVASINSVARVTHSPYPSASMEVAELSPAQQALLAKEEGNAFYKQALYGKAIDCYTKAIGLLAL